MVEYVEGSFWYYVPNRGGAIFFAILFIFSGIVHIWQNFRVKPVRMTLRMTGFLPWGCAVLAAGYVMRAIGSWHYDNLGIFIASYVLLIMGPPVFAACQYIVLGRAMYYVPWLAPMHPGRVITTFLGLDLLCELMLGAGSARVANTSLSDTEQKVGRDLVRAAMILLVVMFAAFLFLAGYFHYKCEKHGVSGRLRRIMPVIYVTSTIILERNILRAVEQFQGYTGTVYTSEPIFMVFEASAMFLVTLILNIWHPATLLPASNKVYLATDGVTEKEGPGWVDKRPFLVTLFDPFDLAGLCGKRKSNVKFWEDDEKSQDQNTVATESKLQEDA